MKLELHLIPRSSFCTNLRNNLSRTKWDQLSKKIRGEANFTCEICGANKITHLHEVWEFKDGIQKLVQFECLCPQCHAVHHWGLSDLQGKDMDNESKESIEAAKLEGK